MCEDVREKIRKIKSLKKQEKTLTSSTGAFLIAYKAIKKIFILILISQFI